MRRMIFGGALACCGLAFVSFGCAHESLVTIGNRGPSVGHDEAGHGPPPHAPAHGHRRNHRHGDRNVEVFFDSQLGVYVVVDTPDHYYWNGHYLRIEDGRWHASTELEGEWIARSSNSLPPGLRKKYSKHGKVKAKPGKGQSPAKGHW